MSKNIYIGVEGKSKTAKTLYFGVNNIAHKVKKVYLGVGGLAKLVYEYIAFVFGNPVLKSEEADQTASIVGTFIVPTINEEGKIVLASTAAKTLQEIYERPDHTIYCSVDTPRTTLTYKTVTDPGTLYSEGTETTGTASSGQTAAITGSTTYTFNNKTGQYTIGSTSSNALSTLYANGTKIYTAGGSTLSSKKVTASATIYSEGSESTSTATGQSGSTSITYYPSYSFSTSTGQYTLTGTKATKTLSSLGVNSSTKYYTTGGTSLVYKKITNSGTSAAYYTEGSVSSTSTTSTSNSSVSGYTSYTFNSSTGNYSSAGSSTSPSYSTMYSNSTTVYTGFGSNLTYKKVTNKSSSTYTYWDYDWDTDSYTDTDFIMSYSGYSDYSFNSSTGEFSGSGMYQSGSLWEGESCYVTCYSPNGRSCSYVSISYDGGWYAYITEGSTTAYSVTGSGGTEYTIVTYTKSRNYISGSTTYTVTTTTKGRTSSTTYTVTPYTKNTTSQPGYKVTTYTKTVLGASAAIVWTLGEPVLVTTASGQTAAISGSKTFNFDDTTGVMTLGTVSSHSLSNLYAPTNPPKVYTSVSNDGKTITYKQVTDKTTTTGEGYYTESGSATSSSSTYSYDDTISGYTSYSFNSSNGNYSSSGSSTTKSYSTLYSSGAAIYTNFGSTLTYKKVTNSRYHEAVPGTYVQEYYEDSPSYYDYGTVTIYAGSDNKIYENCVKGSSAGGGLYYTLSGGEWTYQIKFYSDDEESQGPVYVVNSGTASEATGVTKYWAEWDGSGLTTYSQTLGINGYMSGGSDAYTDYTVTTYNKGSTYQAETSTTTYTVKEYTQTSIENPNGGGI